MQELTVRSVVQPSCSRPLCLGEQISRDARARLIAASSVVLVHCAYPSGHPQLAYFSSGVQKVESLIFFLLVAFPVNVFIVLSFLNIAPRLEAGASEKIIFWSLARKLIPIQLFWGLFYLLMGAYFRGGVLSPQSIFEGVILGTAASHLYFIPLLLALTAAVPLWNRLTKNCQLAWASVFGLWVISCLAEVCLGRETVWQRQITGFVGLTPFALAGIALAKGWKGIAPSATNARKISQLSGLIIIFSMIALSLAWLYAEYLSAGDVVTSNLVRLFRIIYALGIPIWILSWSKSVPGWMVRLAPYTLGIYLVHPVFVVGLRKAQSMIPFFHSLEIVLILPNAILALLISLAAVVLIAKTPLRRFVI
jgi:hypothetical protein